MILVYTDGSTKYTKKSIDNLRPKLIFEQVASSFEIPVGNVELVLLDWRGYASYYWIGLLFSYNSRANIFSISTNTSSSPISVNGHTISVDYQSHSPMITRFKLNTINFY